MSQDITLYLAPFSMELLLPALAKLRLGTHWPLFLTSITIKISKSILHLVNAFSSALQKGI